MLISGCGSDNGFINQPPPAGLLRIVNTIPDSPGLTVDFENQRVGFVNFGESSTFLQVLPDINRELKFFFADNGTLTLLISQAVNVGVDHFVTAVITGTMAAPQIIVIDDAPANFNETTTIAEIRFFHGATTIPSAADFHITAVDAPVGDPLATVAANSVSELIDQESESSSRMRIFNSATAGLLWDSGSFPIASSTRPLFILLDYFGPGAATVRGIVAGITGSTAFPDEDLPGAVSLANMIPDRGPLDIYLDDVLIAEDQLFGDVGNYIELPGGSYTYKLTTADEIDDVVIDTTFTLNNGEFQTVAATGIADSNTILQTFDDLRRVATRSALAITHVAPSAGTIDVYIMSPGESVDDNFPTITQFTFPGSQNLGLEEGTFDFIVTEASTKTVILGPERISLDASGLYRVNITDAIGGGEPAQTILGYDFDPGFNP